MKTIKLSSIALSGTILCLALPAFASGANDSDERTAFNSATISLTDAIAAAEASTGGHAISAEFEREDGQWVYSVEVMKSDASEWEVLIDPNSAGVLATEEDD